MLAALEPHQQSVLVILTLSAGQALAVILGLILIHGVGYLRYPTTQKVTFLAQKTFLMAHKFLWPTGLLVPAPVDLMDGF